MKGTHRPLRRGIALLSLAAMLVLAFQSFPSAHDIPNEVIIQTFVKPEGNRLHFVVRLPLITLLNMNLPKRGPGYLDLEHVDQALKESAQNVADGVALLENDARLTRFELKETQISLPSDKSYATYEDALEHLRNGKLPVTTDVFWNQGFFDAHLEYTIESDRSDFSLRMMLASGLAGRTLTVVRFMPPNGTTRAYELQNDPGVIRLDPRWHQAAWVFIKAGFFHILDGIDHLLFLLCLVIPFRRFRTLIPVVTSFTVAHSITLIASAYNLAPGGDWFPPLIETLIALSIVYMAVENVIAANLSRRWLITFGFGLVHGFGFSFALRQTLQFAGSHLLASLLSFNVGVELGQIMVLLITIPALSLLFRHALAERVGTVILSVLIAHTGWHWMMERFDRLRMVPLPAPDLTLAVTLVRLALILVIASGVGWFVVTQLWRRPATQRVPTTDTNLTTDIPGK